MKPRAFTIYCHTCTVTGRSYVGQTVRKTWETRRRKESAQRAA